MAGPALYLAPVQGITESPFRNAFAKHFRGVDLAISPFISATRSLKLTGRLEKEFGPEHNRALPLIPQILGKEPETFTELADRLNALGYGEINWNLGCPHSTVVKKGKGSGMLPHADRIAGFLEAVIPRMRSKLSIKLRLGLHSKDDILKLIPIFNAFPLTEIIIHPRTGEQMYAGSADAGAFEKCLALSRHRTVYNGDIDTAGTFAALSKRFPSVSRWMLGRGLLRNLFLAEEIKVEAVQTEAEKLERLGRFHNDLFREYSIRLSGPAHLLNKMKEFWGYFGEWSDESKACRSRIHRVNDIPEYNRMVGRLFNGETLTGQSPRA